MKSTAVCRNYRALISYDKPDVEPLQQENRCELNNVELDAYDGGPQLLIDGEAAVIEN